MSFKYAELFAGVLGFGTALDDVGGEAVFLSEIDKFAQQAIRALGKGELLHGDIKEVEAAAVPDHDLLVGGFPCQAFSVAGRRLGFLDMRGTLFFEAVRIVREKRPKIILLENVKGLLGHAKGETISVMLHALNDIGYVVDINILNSKFFDVPQHRERVFIVAVRKDLKEPEQWTDVKGGNLLQKAKSRLQGEGLATFNFEWPEQKASTKKLADILENEVDEKYYLSEEKTTAIMKQLRDADRAEVVAVKGDLIDRSNPQGQYGFSKENIFTMRCAQVHGVAIENTPAIIDTRQKSADKKAGKSGLRVSYDVCPTINATEEKDIKKVMEKKPLMVGSLDYYGNDQMNRVYSPDGVSPTITVVSGGGREKKILTDSGDHYRVRKLTPLECWRLQGFSDEAFDKVRAAGISKSQLYKQAGNAVTVNTVRAIAEKLLPYLH